MKFRPCIDIHNGKVKQIVGGSLKDAADFAQENFVSEYSASDYAQMYEKLGLKGGHVIILNSKDSEYYDATKTQALDALKAYPDGLMIGGGITADNASEFLEAGASHVIVTSYAFKNGNVRYDRIEKLVKTVGKERLVLDLSCRKKDGDYFIVTDRWQKFTEEKLTPALIGKLSSYCDEFLVHAVDAEGKQRGVEEEVVKILADSCDIPVTYAGGIGSFDDIELLRTLGKNKVDATIGSALDIFGGSLDFNEVLRRFDS